MFSFAQCFMKRARTRGGRGIVCQKITCWIVIPSIPGRFYPSSTATQNSRRKRPSQPAFVLIAPFLSAGHRAQRSLVRRPAARSDATHSSHVTVRPLYHHACFSALPYVSWPVFYYVQHRKRSSRALQMIFLPARSHSTSPRPYAACLYRTLPDKPSRGRTEAGAVACKTPSGLNSLLCFESFFSLNKRPLNMAVA